MCWSFPSDLTRCEMASSAYDSFPIGDLVICIPVVLMKHISHQRKYPLTHFTHMLVHGTLHLMGYDHETSDEDAEEMEAFWKLRFWPNWGLITLIWKEIKTLKSELLLAFLHYKNQGRKDMQYVVIFKARICML